MPPPQQLQQLQRQRHYRHCASWAWCYCQTVLLPYCAQKSQSQRRLNPHQLVNCRIASVLPRAKRHKLRYCACRRAGL